MSLHLSSSSGVRLKEALPELAQAKHGRGFSPLNLPAGHGELPRLPPPHPRETPQPPTHAQEADEPSDSAHRQAFVPLNFPIGCVLFSRAFANCFSMQKKWGRDAVICDYVRLAKSQTSDSVDDCPL